MRYRRTSTLGADVGRRLAAVLLTVGLLSAVAGCSAGAAGETLVPSIHPAPLDGAPSAGSSRAGEVRCPAGSVLVDTAEQLTAALAAAGPGTVIELRDGTYAGDFTATAVGTEQAPIWLCGSRNAVLQGPGVDQGYVLHLQGAGFWRLVGFTVRDGKKGVLADAVTDSVLQDLLVTSIGDEGVHLRASSSRNLLLGLSVSGTGLRQERFGEGVYVGSAQDNWCRISACQPDRSDANSIVGSTITATTAEAIDIKEGTTGGLVQDNTFDGSDLRGDADSWVDVKGNDWLITGNHGTSAPGSGFEVHQLLPGWGTGNVFDGNTADVRGQGYGFELRPIGDNRVTCSNTAVDAAQGLSNTACG